jgi:hypothetical protein
MPAFQGQISEEGLLQLVVYIKSLAINKAPGEVAAPGTQPARERILPNGVKK